MFGFGRKYKCELDFVSVSDHEHRTLIDDVISWLFEHKNVDYKFNPTDPTLATVIFNRKLDLVEFKLVFSKIIVV